MKTYDLYQIIGLSAISKEERETQEINTWNWWCLLIIFILQKYYCYSEIVVRNVSVSDVYSAFIYIQSLT